MVLGAVRSSQDQRTGLRAVEWKYRPGKATLPDAKPGLDEMYCSSCGSIIKQRAEICVKCGVRVSGAPFTGMPAASPLNTSGQGAQATLPAEIRGWNWGAFLLTWIWGLGNSTYIAFLTWVPFVGWAMGFVLGAKGSEWAWQNKRWDSVEHFKRVQRQWAWWGLGLVLLSIAIVALVVIAAFAQLMSDI